MGVGVSCWRLARTVAQLGHLGVISGTAIAAVLARRLEDGDPDGSCREALAHFPDQAMAGRVLKAHFVEGGRAPGVKRKSVPMPSLTPSPAYLELTVVGGFAEVWLAKHGHSGAIGMNLLEKIQLPTLPTLYGAMLAGVDVVLMGAGIPRMIPGALDRFAVGEAAEIRLDVHGALSGETYPNRFDPATVLGTKPPQLTRPAFLAIVAYTTLAQTLVRKSNGRVDGFVIEGPTAGGHNAPPRGPLQLNAIGEPIYGPRDLVDLEVFRSLGLPFWMAGSYGRPGRYAAARRAGATGIQVGTAFAFCDESGIDPAIKLEVLRQSKAGTLQVYTDPVASPTGFPFKVVQLAGTMSEPERYAARKRVCDLGFLRHLYRREDGQVGYRCPSEPVDAYLRKGGALEDTVGRKCVCNGLSGSVGLAQLRENNQLETALVTAGDDAATVARYMRSDREGYSAADVIAALLDPAAEPFTEPLPGVAPELAPEAAPAPTTPVAS